MLRAMSHAAGTETQEATTRPAPGHAAVLGVVATRGELIGARVLARSAAPHGLATVVALLDDEDELLDGDEPFRVVRPAQLAGRDLVDHLRAEGAGAIVVAGPSECVYGPVGTPDEPALSLADAHQRIGVDALGRPYLDGVPVSRVDFGGADGLALGEAAADLLRRYAAECRAAGREKLARVDAHLLFRDVDGAAGVILRRLASARREAAADPGDTEALLAWIRRPDPLDPGAHAGVSRFLAALYLERADLRSAFHDLDRGDAPSLVRWAWESDEDYPREVLNPPSEPVPELPLSHAPQVLRGVNLAGPVGWQLGLGEAARLLVRALDDANVPTLVIDTPMGTHPVEATDAWATLPVEDAAFDVNVLCLNGDRLALLSDADREVLLDGRPTAAVWFYEAAELPEDWIRAAERLDEVWVVSECVAATLRGQIRPPVRVIPQAVTVGPAPPLDRGRYGISGDELLYLYVFDFNSTVERKNPEGALEAFVRAFAPGEGAALLLKSINGDRDPTAAERLRRAAAPHPHVHLAEEPVSVAERDALIAGCDCYVSLHRTEGFGLTVAEALLFERPVVVSAIGGVLEFVHEDNALLVPCGDYVLRERRSGYPAGTTWGEPDLDVAAALLRQVAREPGAAAARARRGAADLRRDHAPEAVGQAIAARVEALRAAARTAPNPRSPTARRLIETTARAMRDARIARARA